MQAYDYEDWYHCPVCQRETPHAVHSEGHERDSYYDYRQCAICGARKWEHDSAYTYEGERVPE